jgi:hypothetical protein
MTLLDSEPHSETRPKIEPGTLQALGNVLPPSIDVGSLFERSIRVTNEAGVMTLTEGARVWLVVGVDRRVGAHRLGDYVIRAAVSQSPRGSVAIGTPELQWLLDVGESAKVGDFVVCIVSRGPTGGVTYAIVDEDLWVER